MTDLTTVPAFATRRRELRALEKDMDLKWQAAVRKEQDAKQGIKMNMNPMFVLHAHKSGESAPNCCAPLEVPCMTEWFAELHLHRGILHDTGLEPSQSQASVPEVPSVAKSMVNSTLSEFQPADSKGTYRCSLVRCSVAVLGRQCTPRRRCQA